MSTQILHQLVHGYSHGHSLLAGSTQLERGDMDLVARLSDLSGTLGPELEIAPYLSLYPLPSKRFFALARTWADELAPRTGCVLTHTILIPLKDWAEDDYPIRFARYLRAPRRDSVAEYEVPIQSIPDTERTCAPNEPLAISFVQRYFGEGLTPLVWFGALEPELVAWCVVQILWPSLRARFACCTLALQPRTLDERPFDLLFAPLPTFSRFSDFSRDHIVDSRSPSGDGATEPWFQSLSGCVFEASNIALTQRIRALSADLDPYPTAIRRVFFYLELEERVSTSPTAALGALDLLETLAPQPFGAQQEKRSLALTTLRAIERLHPHEALELLYLLCQRLQGPSFASHHALQEEAQELVQQLVKADPEHSIRQANLLAARHPGAAPRSFILGVGDALLTLLTDHVLLGSTLVTQDTLGERLIIHRPEVAVALLRAGGSGDRKRVISALVAWCRADDQVIDARSALRRILLPEIAKSTDAPLVEELLRDLDPDDVPEICSAVERVDAFRFRPLSELVARFVGERHPSSVQKWCRTHSWHTYQIAALITAGYPPTAEGLHELLTAEITNVTNRPLLLSAFIERVSEYSPPAWLVSLLETDSRLWELLLEGAGDSEVADVVLRLVRDLRRSAMARASEAERTLERFPGKNASNVHEHAVRQLLADQLEGFCDLEKLQRWFAEPWVVETLVHASAGSFRTIVTDHLIRSETAWLRAWEVIESMPELVAFKNTALLQEVISLLLESLSANWVPASTESWRHLLSKVSGGDHVQLDLCGQALHFALEHIRLPLAEVVAETFYPVHNAAMSDRPVQRSWLLWSFADWDKAKDLRRSLVDSFLHSDWNPAQFALSAREPWLLTKLCRRMRRQWGGPQYLEKAYAGLKKFSDPKAQELASALSQFLRNPDVSEEWD